MKTSLRNKTVMLGAVTLMGTLLAPAPARAGHGDWSTAGKILTGVVAADVLFNHLPLWARDRRVVYERPVQYVYVQPPAVGYAVMQPPPPPGPVWHEGHDEYVPKNEWVDTSREVEDWVQGHREADGRWVDAHKIRRTERSGYWQQTQTRVWVEPGYR